MVLKHLAIAVKRATPNKTVLILFRKHWISRESAVLWSVKLKSIGETDLKIKRNLIRLQCKFYYLQEQLRRC